MGAPRLSLRVKLLAGTLTLVALSGVISLLAITKLTSVGDSGHDLYEHAYVPAVAAGTAQSAARDLNLQSVKMDAVVIPQMALTAVRPRPPVRRSSPRSPPTRRCSPASPRSCATPLRSCRPRPGP